MDILIPDSWLREFVKTKAKPEEIAKYLSLCGPSVERIKYHQRQAVYAIEITTNRMDTAGVIGIAREVAAILPRFGIAAELIPFKTKYQGIFTKKVKYLAAEVDSKLCPRSTAVLIKDVTVGPSPKYIQERLEMVGVRPLNNVIDISNYVMHELGQPMHTFDYDKIQKAKMVLRASKKGETITTLDSQAVKLPGEDIAIADGSGRLIDLPGIMGGKNSMIDANTKNVLLFVQTYDPSHIRKTSMTLAKRSEASSLFEKGLDPELVGPTTQRAVDLFVELTKGKPEAKVLDIYPKPFKGKELSLTHEFIVQRLGVAITQEEITQILAPLGFRSKWASNTLTITVPSYRASDISMAEDVIEEIARIYGYANLPDELMDGPLPKPILNSPFAFENKIKDVLKGLGGVEVYTLSLVPESFVDKNALKLKNPLGKDYQYLRTSLRQSLISAALENSGEKEPFHLFEIANIYTPTKNDLPHERMFLGGIFSSYDYRPAKGIIEALLTEMNISVKYQSEENMGFVPSKHILIKGKENLGQFGVTEEGEFIYYEFEIEKLRENAQPGRVFTPIPKYPPQIEDLTLTFPQNIKIGGVLDLIKSHKEVGEVMLKDIYENAYTIHILYQNPSHTLNNIEVEKIRNKLLQIIEEKFGGKIKN